MAIIKVKTGGITADAVTDALIADDVVGTEHLTANEVDTAALGADAVTGAQLADNAVNSEHYTDGSIDTAHIADAQITAAKLASGVGEITEVDMWRLTTGYSGASDITSNWERADTDNFAVLGTGLSQSSGIFTFPSTGYYLITFIANFVRNGDDRGMGAGIKLTTNNSSYSDLAFSSTFIQQTESDATTASASVNAIAHCTDVSNVKISFNAGGSGTNVNGNTGFQETGFTCVKLADT